MVWFFPAAGRIPGAGGTGGRRTAVHRIRFSAPTRVVPPSVAGVSGRIVAVTVSPGTDRPPSVRHPADSGFLPRTIELAPFFWWSAGLPRNPRPNILTNICVRTQKRLEIAANVIH